MPASIVAKRAMAGECRCPMMVDSHCGKRSRTSGSSARKGRAEGSWQKRRMRRSASSEMREAWISERTRCRSALQTGASSGNSSDSKAGSATRVDGTARRRYRPMSRCHQAGIDNRDSSRNQLSQRGPPHRQKGCACRVRGRRSRAADGLHTQPATRSSIGGHCRRRPRQRCPRRPNPPNSLHWRRPDPDRD